MTPKAQMKKMIVPIEKKLPVETPDKIPENASIEDYEKIAYKMSMSSDEIIDRALDKLESRDSTKNSQTKERKNSKVSTPKPSKKKDTKPEKGELKSNSESINQPTEQLVNQLEEETEMVAHCATETDIKHEEELKKLTDEIDALKTELEKSKSSMFDESFRNEIVKLSKKNDELLLKNSDLEFEVSRLSAENNRLKQELEQLSNSKRLPPQTYSSEGYTRTPIQGQHRVIPTRMGMNGYESWN